MGEYRQRSDPVVAMLAIGTADTAPDRIRGLPAVVSGAEVRELNWETFRARYAPGGISPNTWRWALGFVLVLGPAASAGSLLVGPGQSIQDAFIETIDGDEIVVATGFSPVAVDPSNIDGNKGAEDAQAASVLGISRRIATDQWRLARTRLQRLLTAGSATAARDRREVRVHQMVDPPITTAPLGSFTGRGTE